MSPPWDALDAALASIGRSFGHDVARDLEAEGARDVADLLRGAIAGHPRGAGGKAAEAAWARLRSDAGWPSFAWRECYVIGQLRDAAEAGQAAADPSTAAADDASPGSGPAPPPRDATTRAILARRAMLAVDMTHIMGAPAELVHPFARAVEALARDLDDDGRRPTMTTTSRDDDDDDAARDAPAPPLFIPDVLPPGRAPAIDPAHALERAEEGLAPKAFKRRYFNQDKPAALGALGAAWPATRKWRDLAWLRETHGHRNVPLEVGAFGDEKNWREEVVTLRRFIDAYLAPGLAEERAAAGEERRGEPGAPHSPGAREGLLERGERGSPLRFAPSEVAYLAQHQLFDQIPDLLADFDAPDLLRGVGSGGALRTNAWIGTAGTVTPLHFDSDDNLLGQIAGYKFVRLYAESDTPYLYRGDPGSDGAYEEGRARGGGGEGGEEARGGDGKDGGGDGRRRKRRDAQGNFSRVDAEAPDLDAFPLFRRATHMDVVLGPGEFVYVPARCWHYVRALTTSVSVNFSF